MTLTPEKEAELIDRLEREIETQKANRQFPAVDVLVDAKRQLQRQALDLSTQRQAREAAENEVERLRGVAESAGRLIIDYSLQLERDLRTAQAEIDRLKSLIEKKDAALTFYANSKIYEGNGVSRWTPASEDCGKAARTALNSTEAKTGGGA